MYKHVHIFEKRSHVIQSLDTYFQGITLLWLRHELKPVSTCYNFLFHVGFINTATGDKTLVRNIILCLY